MSHYSFIQIKNSMCFICSALLPSPMPLATTDPFTSHSSSISRMSYKWTHTVCSLFQLASFT